MKWNRNLSNTDAGPFIRSFPVFGGGANVNDESIVVIGATAGTNDGFIINPASATAALANVVGVAAGTDTNTVSGADSNTTGTNYTLQKVICNPDAIYLAEYDQTSTIGLTSSVGTTVTPAGTLEANMGRGWLYAVSGTGAGKLAFIATSTSGSCTTKTAMGWDATTTIIKILPLFRTSAILSNNSRKLGTQAAAGGSGYLIFGNQFEADGIPMQPLDPTKHDNLTLTNAKFFAEVIFTAYIAAI